AEGALAVVVVPDEQVGDDRGQLPEHVQHQGVVGAHQPEHGAGEGHEHPGEPAQALCPGGEVPGAVDQHQGAHSAHDEHHEPGQGVQPEGQVHADGTHPAEVHCGDVTCQNGAGLGQCPDGGCAGGEGQAEEGFATVSPYQCGRSNCRHKVYGK